MAEFEASGIRISDTERESALTALGEHMAAGRLDIDEYGERSAKVSTAKTRADLLDLFGDLPEPHPTFAGQAAPPTAQPAPAPVPVRAGSSRMAVRRAAAGVLPLLWLGAIALMAAGGFNWVILLVPIALTMMGSAVWGKGWHKERPQRSSPGWERAREEMRDARDEMRDGVRQGMRQMRHEMRNQRRGWQQDLKHQIRNDVYRRMRDQRNRGRN